MSLPAMLAATYDPPQGRAREWGYWTEVSVGARQFDAIAVNLWASRGWTVRGHELKVSRADWLNERKDPAKAEAGYRLCDEWYLVADKGVVLDPDAELPTGWGLMVPDRKHVKIVRAATAHEPAIARAFWIRLLVHTLDAEAREARHADEAKIRAEVRDELTRQMARDDHGLSYAQRHLINLGMKMEKILGTKSGDGADGYDWDADPLYNASDADVRTAARLARGILRLEREKKLRLEQLGRDATQVVAFARKARALARDYRLFAARAIRAPTPDASA